MTSSSCTSGNSRASCFDFFSLRQFCKHLSLLPTQSVFPPRLGRKQRRVFTWSVKMPSQVKKTECPPPPPCCFPPPPLLLFFGVCFGSPASRFAPSSRRLRDRCCLSDYTVFCGNVCVSVLTGCGCYCCSSPIVVSVPCVLYLLAYLL